MASGRRPCLREVMASLLTISLFLPSEAFAPMSAQAVGGGLLRTWRGLGRTQGRASGVPRMECMARKNAVDVDQGVDLYSTLGVDKQADAAEIKSAYRKLAAKYHPDVNPNGAERFMQITRAFEVLGDEQSRRQYNYGRVSGLSDDFAQRVSGFREQAGPGYRAAADKVEAALSDERRLVALQLMPVVILLVLTTIAPDFLHDLLLGPRDKEKKRR